MSEFSVPVVRIGTITKHPNADKLSITQVDGCPVIIQTADFKEGDLAVYIPIESVIPLNHPAFEFLRDPHHPERETVHIKAKRLRGVFSMGLLIPVGAFGSGPFAGRGSEGRDVAEYLGIVKYEEPEPQNKTASRGKQPWWKTVRAWFRHPILMFKHAFLAPDSDCVKDPHIMPTYDMESLRKYRAVIQPGEPVYVSEKIHGSNARFCVKGNKFWVGSHKRFKKHDENSWWWRIAVQYDFEKRLQNHPGIAVYGEIYGVQDLKYGTKNGELGFVVFDFYDTDAKRFLDYDEFVALAKELDLPRVPQLYLGPYDAKLVDPLADGKTTMAGANHIREGIVIKPVVERRDHVGRVIFKLVSENYLLRHGGTEFH